MDSCTQLRPGTRLTRRYHVDLARTASMACRPARSTHALRPGTSRAV